MIPPFHVELVSGGREVRHRYRVDRLPIRIGRGYDNDVILDDPHVSAHHAVVEPGDGGVVVRDRGSRNGIRYRRGNYRELPIDGSTLFQLGHTRLRVRGADFSVDGELADTTIHGWEGWPPALAGLLLLGGLSLVGSWADQTEKFEAVTYLLALVIVLGLGVVWCGGWAFAGRLFGGNARFGRHLFILGCGCVGMEGWSLAAAFAAYAFSWEALTRYGSHGLIAIFATMIYCHLRHTGQGRGRQLAVAGLLLALLCSGVKLMIDYRVNGVAADELVMQARFPPSLRVSADWPLSRFMADAARLRERVDRERAKPVEGDETDDEDGE